MFTRRFKTLFARICVALLCMQAALSAYACPAFLVDIQAAVDAAPVHDAHPVAPPSDCDQHAKGSADKTMCHQHYAGDQSVGAASLASASAAPTLPLAIFGPIAPIVSTPTVLPVLLQRSTAPPLSIRFQVLRI